MKDLVWTKPPKETPAEGPDTRGFYDIARYGVSADRGNYTQWITLEFLLDTNHKPPLFWRKMTAGQDVTWTVAKVPMSRQLMNRCPDHPTGALVDRKDGTVGCAVCGKPVTIESVTEG